MAKPCRIDDTVCVQPRREVIGSSFFPVGLFECASRRAVRMTVRDSGGLPKGCPRIRPVGLSEGLSRGLPKGCPEIRPGADKGVHPRGWEVVNPSCGDLHRRSTSTLLPLCYESVTIRSNLVCISIVILGVLAVRNFFVFCCIPLQWHHEPCYA